MTKTDGKSKSTVYRVEIYQPLEHRIKKNDLDALLARWEFGRKLLAERGKNKRLANGRLDELARALASCPAELKNRMQFAEEYPTKAKVAVAFEEYRSWFAICDRALGERKGNQARNAERADDTESELVGDGVEDTESELVGDGAEGAESELVGDDRPPQDVYYYLRAADQFLVATTKAIANPSPLRRFGAQIHKRHEQIRRALDEIEQTLEPGPQGVA